LLRGRAFGLLIPGTPPNPDLAKGEGFRTPNRGTPPNPDLAKGRAFGLLTGEPHPTRTLLRGGLSDS